MPTIALVSARRAVDLDDDLGPLADALLAAGATARIVCWDDPGVAWDRFDAAVLRSAWDYPERLADFTAWARQTDSMTALWNPPPIIEWNADKRYLVDLERAGVPTVPTTFCDPGDEPRWPEGTGFVVKPVISAGSRDTARFAPGDEARAAALAARIHETGRAAMIQPYLPAVDTEGERALVWIGGRHSHTFRKGPILRPGQDPTPDLFAAEDISPSVASPDETAVAAAALEATTARCGVAPLYARVDVATDLDGRPCVLELELIEPSVYHHVDPRSATRFAHAILDRIRP